MRLLRLFCLTLLFFGSYSIDALVGEVVPGQPLWGVTKRIAETVDIIQSKVCLLESVMDVIENCSPIPITSADIISGIITISTAGSYCLAEDLTATLTITADCVSVDLNNHCLTGVVSISSDDTEVKNGRITPAAPTSAPTAAVTIGGTSDRARIEDVLVICTNTSADAVAGRAGIEIHGNDSQILGSTIKSGAAGDATFTTAGAGGNGIIVGISANNVVITNCIVSTGDGGTTSNAASDGGDGGNGFFIDSDATETEITQCTVLFTGNGGDGGGSGTGGDGGEGVFIVSTALDTVIRNCTLRNTGAGGSGGNVGAAGKAIEDDVTIVANLSMCYSNFAHNISNTIKYDLQGSGVEEGVALANPPTTTVVNSFANVFVS